jgi:AcrR family transcriptional regulator
VARATTRGIQVPTDTWDKLPTSRRDRVLNAAEREFGRHGYSGGSLNVIAREAGVAKGSLFQYFTDKLDFYAYVCACATERIRGELVPVLIALDPTRPFGPWLADMLIAWIAYFRTHPVERGIVAATNLEMDPEVRAAVRDVANAAYLEVLRPLVVGFRDRGDLNADVDVDVLLAYLLLLAPHLALAPYLPGIDAVLGLLDADEKHSDDVVRRLVAVLEVALTPEP